ncbi:MAG TPA: ABC transporter permease [Spirochaetota bacterium]|nr:ABC transporter permease [Spirochaetota bacterium]HPI87835.1 ABC transporter permease [Spirochaetota bacterium]HPR47433.1 ABC transporter permease [Spirochaetota bacterium]
MKRGKKSLFVTVVAAFGLVSLSLVALPVLGMFAKTSLDELVSLFADREVISSILLTFETAVYATLFALIFGTPLAYALARFDFPGRRFIESLVSIPIIVPHTAAGIALLVVFASGPVGAFFASLGIDFMGTRAGIVLGMCFVSIPFYIDTVKEGFASIDDRIEHVARSLGARQYQVFFRVMLPLAMRSVLAGSLLMWGRGISEFGAVVILAYHPMIAPVLIYERFTSFGLKSSRPVAVLLIIMCIIVFLILRILSGIRVSRRARADRD